MIQKYPDMVYHGESAHKFSLFSYLKNNETFLLSPKPVIQMNNHITFAIHLDKSHLYSFSHLLRLL